MKAQKQILYIHGGMTFKTHKEYIHYLKTRSISIDKQSWSGSYLDKKLGKAYQIIRPRMPWPENSKYEEWKIHFELHFPFLKNDVILIGKSLGGIFLAKYLSENTFPKKIKAVFLVAPPFDDTVSGEDLRKDFWLKKDLALLEKQTKNLYLMFSEDDPCVPISHADKYEGKLGKGIFIIFKHNGHFSIPEFPEIVAMIKKLGK